MRVLQLVAVAALLAGCAPSVDRWPAVTGFEAARYQGTWYEIARLPTSFEDGLTDIRAEYTLRPDGSLGVRNSGLDEEGEPSEVEGEAWFAGEPQVADLRVSFFWFFSAPYRVIELDQESYAWAVVTSGEDYLWILARTPLLEEAIYERLVSGARARGFATERLIRVPHGKR